MKPHWPQPVRPLAGSPNILVVLFDDVGFSDLGCFGSAINTPTIDGLAERGLRYTGFHTTAMCSTTRAALLTGRNHHSVGVGCLANFDSGYPGYRGKIAPDAGTLAEVLQHAGYRNYMLGKWHVTPLTESGPTGPFDGWPLGRGFHRFYGFLDAETDHYAPELVADNGHVVPPGNFDSGYHLTADLFDKAIDFISSHTAALPDTPWLTWVGLGACHAPHQAPRELIDHYDARFNHGWDEEREQRLARQIELGIVPAGTQLPPRNFRVKSWAEHDADEQRLFCRLQAAYAAMLDHADQHLGRLIEHLRNMGELDNTLVLVLSDNGASQEGGPAGFVNAMGPYNGIKEPLAAKLEKLADIGGPASHSNFPWGWAMAANTPLKRYKQNTHGGGIRDPLIVHWPSRIRESGLRHQFCHASDIMPTVLDAIGVAAPARLKGLEQKPIEGVSFAHTFTQPSASTRKHTQYFEMFGHRGLVHQNWKAVAFHAPGSAFEDDEWELYDLSSDFNELHDLAATHADKLAELQAMWWREAEQHQVLPLDDRFAPRFAENAARHTGARRRFVFWAGMGHLPSDVAPDLRSRSYRITARLEDFSAGDHGVLISHGDTTSGYSLYVDTDGCLAHDLNIGGSHQIVRSPEPVPAGTQTLGFEMRRAGQQGTGTLLIDGVAVATMNTGNIFAMMISWSGLDIGMSRGNPVSFYTAPFVYTGRLLCVEVELQDDQQLDGEGVGKAELMRE